MTINNEKAISLYESMANVAAVQARGYTDDTYFAWVDCSRAYYAAAVCARMAEEVPAVAATARRHELMYAEKAAKLRRELLGESV